MDPKLFPDLPEDLSDDKVSDEDLVSLLMEHEVALEAINENNPDFLKGISPEDELAELERGTEQIEQIKGEQKRREDVAAEWLAKKEELAARAKQALSVEEEGAAEGEGEEEAAGEEEEEAAELAEGEEAEGEGEEAGAEAEASEEGTEPLAAEATDVEETEETEEKEEAKEGATASAAPAVQKKRTSYRRPPAPSAERRGEPGGSGLIAVAGQVGLQGGKMLDRMSLAEAVKSVARSIQPAAKSAAGIEQRFLVASASFQFPEERKLFGGDPAENARKIRAAIPAGIPGLFGLIASGGLCAPLENIYTLVNFASQARPVRAALASFQAERGGVNVPESPTIGEITEAISLISVEEDALGGTFATKSCQDLDCVDYVETAVSVISHCREYGNLNARAWPERIAHENDLTMAAWARTAETFLLDRIKAQSIKRTAAAVGSTMNAFASLVYVIGAATAGVKRRLRMDDNVQFRTILPSWIGEVLAADDALKQLDTADRARAALTAKLGTYGIRISYSLDDPTGASTFAASLDDNDAAIPLYPGEVQYPLYPEGEFVHLDMGTLDLGLVRDSTLNSTNDFQLFGESFENVARIGPAQAALWITQDICPNGVYPALGTAPTCS
jgi:hypothetical protein